MVIDRRFSFPRGVLIAWIVSALVALALTFAPPSVQAAGLGAGDCTHHKGLMASPIRWKGYEHINQNGGQAGKVLCVHVTGGVGFDGFLNMPDLKTWDAGSWCMLQAPTSLNTWNDCVSSDRWSLGCRQRILIFADANYNTPKDIPRGGAGERDNIGDNLSSFKVTDGNICI